MPRSLRIDPAACDGVGICAVVAPEVITLDPWGFPTIAESQELGSSRPAEQAARACPHRALHLREDRTGNT